MLQQAGSVAKDPPDASPPSLGVTFLDGISLLIAILAALFAASQSSAADNANIKADEANKLAERALTLATTLAHRQAKVDSELADFRDNCARHCDELVQTLLDLPDKIAAAAERGEMPPAKRTAEWHLAKQELQSCRRLMRTFEKQGVITPEHVDACFSNSYDLLVVAFSDVIEADDATLNDKLTILSVAIERFQDAVRTALSHGTSAIIAQLSAA